MARQHERLRVPEGWQGQARALIQQLERIHDDLYNLLGKGDIPEAVQDFMDETSEDISGLQEDVSELDTTVGGLGDDVDTLETNMTGAQDDIDDLEALTQALAKSAAIVCTGDTHVALTAGEFVFVQDHETLTTGPYYAKENIAADEALSTTNLGSVTKGLSNSLQSAINGIHTNYSVTSPMTFDTDYVQDTSSTMYRNGTLRILKVSFTCKAAASGWQTIGTIASGHRPKAQVYEPGVNDTGGCKRCTINTSGNLRILGREAVSYTCTFVYFV